MVVYCIGSTDLPPKTEAGSAAAARLLSPAEVLGSTAYACPSSLLSHKKNPCGGLYALSPDGQRMQE